MTKNRNERLKADYLEMLKIQNRPYLSWIATKGELPYAEEYLLFVDLRTYAFSVDSGVNSVGVIRRCVIRVTLWDSYPYVAPNIKMLNIPPVFHPDWYSKGTYCSSESWRPETTLKEYLMRMLRTLTYDPSLIVSDAPANYKALDWYQKNRGNTALFPSDRIELTENDPDTVAELEKSGNSFDGVVDCWGSR